MDQPQSQESLPQETVQPSQKKKVLLVSGIVLAGLIFLAATLSFSPFYKLLPQQQVTEDIEEDNTVLERKVLEQLLSNPMLTAWAGDIRGIVTAVSPTAIKVSPVTVPGISLTIHLTNGYLMLPNAATHSAKQKRVYETMYAVDAKAGDVVYGHVYIGKKNNKWIASTDKLFIDQRKTSNPLAPTKLLDGYSKTAFITSPVFLKLFAHVNGTVKETAKDTITLENNTNTVMLSVVEPGGKSRFTREENNKVTLARLKDIGQGDTMSGEVTITTSRFIPVSARTSEVGTILATIFLIK